jgi:DNA-binding MarR family transcriptional regulator
VTDRFDEVATMSQALTRVAGGMQRARRRRTGASAMTLLQAVADGGPVRPSALAGHLGVTRAAVTGQVQELAARGAVELSPDPDDGRSVLVRITPAGLEELTALNRRGVERFLMFTRDWDISEIRTLGRLLEKLESSIAGAVRHEPPVTGAQWRRTRDGPVTDAPAPTEPTETADPADRTEQS